MKSQPSSPPPSAPAASARPLVWAVTGVLLLACVGGVWWKFHHAGPTDATVEPDAAPTPVAPVASPALAPSHPLETPPVTLAVNPPPAAPEPAASPAPVVAGPVADLVAGLLRLRGTNALTSEQVQAWRGNLQQIVQQGGQAIPALRAFLASKEDLQFDAATARALGYHSARLGALDALRQIGGPEAIALMDESLATAKSPREIAALAWNLNGLTENQYRAKSLAAARDALARAWTATTPGDDVAPLFEVFQRFGDGSNVAELQKATSKWNHYALSALAHLPDGAGVPALAQMADPNANHSQRLGSLQMLAQLAVESQIAQQALIGQMAGNQITPVQWAYLRAQLGGDEIYPADAVLTQYPSIVSWGDIKSTHIQYGNQNYYTLPSDEMRTVDGINRRLMVLDQFLAVTTDPTGKQTLQQVKETLTRRLAQAGAAPATAPGR